MTAAEDAVARPNDLLVEIIRSKKWRGWKVAPSLAKIQEQGIAMMRAGLNKAQPPRKRRKTKAELIREGWANEPFGGFSFRLPWAPSVNGCYFNLQKKGRVRTTKAREFEAAAIASLLEQQVPRKQICHPLAVHVVQHADSARGDIDNGLKIVMDVLKKHGVIADDCREIVKRITVEDGERCKEPWVEVRISAVISNDFSALQRRGWG